MTLKSETHPSIASPVTADGTVADTEPGRLLARGMSGGREAGTDTGWQPSTDPATRDEVKSSAAASIGDNDQVSTSIRTDSTTDGRQGGWGAALTAELCLWFTAIAWGTNLLVVKTALANLNEWVFNTSRLTLATLVLGWLAWLEYRYRPGATGKIAWLTFAGFALLNGFLYQVFFFLGISQTTAGNTALLLSSMPMWTALFSSLVAQDKLPLTGWVGLLVTFCGTLFVLLQNTTVDLSGDYLIGNLFVLAGAMTWALATVISRPLLQVMSPLRLAFLSSLSTMPLHILLCLPFLEEAWPSLSVGSNWAAIIYSGLISTGVAYATWHYGVRHLGGARAGIYQNVVTLVAVIGGWLFLREPVLSAQFLGGAAIVLGVILMRLKK